MTHTALAAGSPSYDEQHAREVAARQRFEFGANWARFLTLLDDSRIAEAETSLTSMLDTTSLNGLRFLDVGSGSGLFSLAARRLGARVHSFDYDPQSVNCTAELRRRFFPDDQAWTVEQGSVLDSAYVDGLGAFDVTYSWGVLHHTGDMWRALEHAQRTVVPGGQLFIALYNDVGSQSARWKRLKQTYAALPRALRPAFAALTMAPQETKTLARAILRGRPSDYVRTWTHYGEDHRGMSKWRDIVDWVGGYPYEAATVDLVFAFFKERGYLLEQLRGGKGLGCNEFVFRKR
jgi:2-polyprenyl-6-hydroxyphenyl methylase/3-demethylubiquinone-9 3-methyltransferase